MVVGCRESGSWPQEALCAVLHFPVTCADWMRWAGLKRCARACAESAAAVAPAAWHRELCLKRRVMTAGGGFCLPSGTSVLHLFGAVAAGVALAIGVACGAGSCQVLVNRGHGLCRNRWGGAV